MSEIFDNILQLFVNYPVQLLVGALLFFPFIKRRKYFLIKFISSIIIFLVISYAMFFTRLRFYLSFRQFSAVYIILYLIVAALLTVNFKVSVWEALFYASAAYCMQHCLYNTAHIVESFFDYGWREWPNYLVNFILNIVMYAAFYFIFIRRIKKGENIGLNNKYIIVLSVITIALVYVLSRWLESYYIGLPAYIFSIVCCLLLLFIQFSLFERGKLQRQADTLQQILKLEQQQQKTAKESMEFISMKCHDLKHQITALRTANDALAQEKTISSLEKSIMIYDSVAKTDNESLDIVLTEKGMICEKHEIKLSIIADGDRMDFMKAEDIYSLFGNAMDNAIESILKIPDADKRFISLNIRGKGDLVIVHIENYFEEELTFEKGLPVTTKDEKSVHGYGMKSIQYIVDKYNGTLTLNTENNIFSLNMMFYR